jgi:hypothetical protein
MKKKIKRNHYVIRLYRRNGGKEKENGCNFWKIHVQNGRDSSRTTHVLHSKEE